MGCGGARKKGKKYELAMECIENHFKEVNQCKNFGYR